MQLIVKRLEHIVQDVDVLHQQLCRLIQMVHELSEVAWIVVRERRKAARGAQKNFITKNHG